MTAWHNPMLTISELAVMARTTERWLREKLRSDDPFPTRQRGRQVKVLWSDYCEWDERLYGDKGTNRGQEILDVKIGGRK